VLGRDRLSRTSVLVLLFSVITGFGLAALTDTMNNRDNHRLLVLQANDSVISITSLLSQFEGTMSSYAAVASATGGDSAALANVAKTEQGYDGFTALAVLKENARGAPTVTTILGKPRIAAPISTLPSEVRTILARTLAGPSFQVVGFLGTGQARLLILSARASTDPSQYVSYAEIPLPEGTVVPMGYPKLDFAVFSGTASESETLFSNTGHVPLHGERVNVYIDIASANVVVKPKPGEPTLLLAVSARGSLLSTPALLLPWILGTFSLVMGGLVIMAVDSAARRRDLAIEVAKDLRQKNMELDDAMARSIESEQERQRLEAELHQAQRLETVGQLAGGIAHDFNNLLMVIQTHVDFLAEEIPQDEMVQSDLAEVRNAARRAAELTRRLLVFSRRDLVRPSALDVNSTVADVLGLLKRSVGEDVRLDMMAGGSVPRVMCDAGELHQVLVNLVVNSRQAIEGSGTITVATSVQNLDARDVALHPDVVPGRYVRVSVSDTGAGMSPETMARIFEPYFTTKDPGTGTGLGLSTVYGIVRRYGGFTTVESTPDIGTVISIHLPATDREPEVPTPEPAVEISAAAPQKVLVVEDEDGVRRACQRILEGAGYDVIQASSAAEALANYEPDDFDMLLTDVVMPGPLSGRDLVTQLHHRRPELPVLYMSGYSQDAIAKRGVLDEGVMVIGKPFTPSELLTKVGAVLAAAGSFVSASE
jgi:signal transduction histidine kinase